MSLTARAQQPVGNTPPPPALQPLDEGEEPAVTIRQPDRQGKTTEKRAPGGKVTEIKVTSGGSTYYLKPNDSSGSALPGDGQASSMRAAQWEVLEFDFSRPQEAKEVEAAQSGQADLAPVPPSPTPARK
ncbi:DUF2782 domain-containing protein [Noviherbaspirillum saxi]|nr:DUF2782 domain-containing protein [Noviherbaspirillum saxi]